MTDFLWDAGTSNNGLVVSAISLLTTELNSLTNNSTALSSVNGTSGVFNNAGTGQAMLGEVFLTLGAVTPTAGAVLSGWFIQSYDGGTTFEITVSGASQARPVDFLIPLNATAITAGWVFKAQGPIMIPALPFKVFVQNGLGASMAASANTLRLAPFAVKY